MVLLVSVGSFIRLLLVLEPSSCFDSVIFIGERPWVAKSYWKYGLGGGILLALSFDLFGGFLIRRFPLGLWLLPSRYEADSFRQHGAIGDKPEQLDGRIWLVCWCEKI